MLTTSQRPKRTAQRSTMDLQKYGGEFGKKKQNKKQRVGKANAAPRPPPSMACLINKEENKTLFLPAWLPNLVPTHIMYVHRVYAKIVVCVCKYALVCTRQHLWLCILSLGFDRYGSDIDNFFNFVSVAGIKMINWDHFYCSYSTAAGLLLLLLLLPRC